MRLWALTAVLAASCGSCEPDPPVTEPPVTEPGQEMPSDRIELPDPDLRLAFVTDLKGYLEPCGCSANQLGGIDHLAFRMAELDPAPLFAVGDLLFDDASHGGPRSADVDLWRAETLLRILGQARLRSLTPGRPDAARPEQLATLQQSTTAELLASGWTLDDRPLPASTTLQVDDVSVRVTGISDGQVGADDQPAREAIAADQSDVGILLVRGDRRSARSLTELDVDFLVLGGIDREEPTVPSERNGTWTLQGGRQGQGVLIVELWRPTEEGAWQNFSQWNLDAERERLDTEIAELAEQLDRWREEGTHADDDLQRQSRRLEGLREERRRAVAPTFPEAGRVFAARWEPLDPRTVGHSPDARRTLQALDVRINDHNQEAFADRTPPPAAEGVAHYVGSRRCASCHAPAYAWWSEHAHGRAYATLEERNKQFHLDCVGCHVTGYERPGGSTVTHLLDGALQNVGCEVCHGPGSTHVESSSADDIERDPRERLCITCHNEEHSELFQYDAYRAMILVPGHGRLD